VRGPDLERPINGAQRGALASGARPSPRDGAGLIDAVVTQDTFTKPAECLQPK
jgi:hypothetical protein